MKMYKMIIKYNYNEQNKGSEILYFKTLEKALEHKWVLTGLENKKRTYKDEYSSIIIVRG